MCVSHTHTHVCVCIMNEWLIHVIMCGGWLIHEWSHTCTHRMNRCVTKCATELSVDSFSYTRGARYSLSLWLDVRQMTHLSATDELMCDWMCDRVICRLFQVKSHMHLSCGRWLIQWVTHSMSQLPHICHTSVTHLEKYMCEWVSAAHYHVNESVCRSVLQCNESSATHLPHISKNTCVNESSAAHYDA